MVLAVKAGAPSACRPLLALADSHEPAKEMLRASEFQSEVGPNALLADPPSMHQWNG